ncbi:c-type cytochrome [Massilia sp. LXY-6]|uniref:c-type cytochrome n=1 Tax=Massilia sp. LXY-6 TaxID=3379823 RepID=UPI003EE3FD44
MQMPIRMPGLEPAALPLALLLTLLLALLAAGPALAADPDPALVEQGKYLALAGDCIACHTAPGGKPMAGGLPLASPLGVIVSTNITPSRSAGIGNYTLAQFSDALRRGVRADGARLYPAMPYTAYALVSDADTRALYAYFMLGVAPVDTRPAQHTALPFPFNIRGSMALWNAMFLDTKPFAADPAKSADINRGAYLVRGLGHCGACHTPRNSLMAESSGAALSGAALGPWYAPNITADPNSGVGGWSVDELAAYMKSGHAAGKAHAAGPMVEAIDNSLAWLTPADLRAMAVYLKQTPAVHDAADTRPPYAWGAPGNELDSIRGVAWPADRSKLTGAQLYDAHCASCHHASGEGSIGGGLPSLFHASSVGRSNTNNLVMIMLDGISRGSTSHEVVMPAFGKVLSDQQAATLGSYVAHLYGNPAATVTVAQVAKLRAGGQESPLVGMVRGALLLVVIVLVVLVAWIVMRRRPRT